MEVFTDTQTYGDANIYSSGYPPSLSKESMLLKITGFTNPHPLVAVFTTTPKSVNFLASWSVDGYCDDIKEILISFWNWKHAMGFESLEDVWNFKEHRLMFKRELREKFICVKGPILLRRSKRLAQRRRIVCDV